jgi:hypothetical protein
VYMIVVHVKASTGWVYMFVNGPMTRGKSKLERGQVEQREEFEQTRTGLHTKRAHAERAVRHWRAIAMQGPLRPSGLHCTEASLYSSASLGVSRGAVQAGTKR